MALAPESAVLSEQYVQILQRISFQDANLATAIGSKSIASAFSTGVNIPIPKGQAIRVVSAAANISDQAASGFLAVQSAAIDVSIQDGSGPGVFTFPWYGSNAILSAGQGLWIQGNTSELIYWNDWTEVGGIPPGINLVVGADVLNNDPTNPQSVTIGGVYLVEYYLLGTKGHLGFP